MTNQDNIFNDPANKFLIDKDKADKGVVDFFSNTGDNYMGKTGDIGDAGLDAFGQVNPVTPNVTEINILDKQIQDNNTINQNLLIDPPEKETVDPPEGYEFKFFKTDNIRLPKNIKKQFISTLYDADVQISEISNQISADLKPKWDNILQERINEFNKDGKLNGLSKQAFSLNSDVIAIQDQVNKEFNAEMMSLLSVRTKDIYDNVKKSQEDILSGFSSINRVNRLKERMDVITAPMDYGAYWLNQNDKNWPAIKEMMKKMDLEMLKPNPDMDMVNSYSKAIKRHYDISYNSPTLKLQKFDNNEGIVVDGKWVYGSDAPKWAINSSELNVGQQIYVGDGSKYIHYETSEGQDMFINAVNASSNYWSLDVKEEPVFDVANILGIGEKKGVQIPYAQSTEDRMYSEAKEKYGVDPRNIVLRKVEGQPEKQFEYWDVIESGTFEVYGKKLPQFEINIGNGKSIVPHLRRRQDYGEFLLDGVTVYGRESEEVKKKIRARNVDFISNLGKAYVGYIDILSPNLSQDESTAWKKHVANYMEYFDPSRLMYDDGTINSRRNFIRSMRVGEPTGPFGLPEYADRFLRWMIQTGKYKEANEFSPTAMYNMSLEFMKETITENENKLKEITISNGMSGEAGLRWVSDNTDRMNQMATKVQEFNNRILQEIDFIDRKLKSNPNDQELLKRRNSLALTYQNNFSTLKTEYQNRSVVFNLQNDPNFIEAAAVQDQIDNDKDLFSQSTAVLQWEQGLKKQEAPSGMAKYAMFLAMTGLPADKLPDAAVDAYYGFGTGLLDRGLTFINSTFGFIRQASIKLNPIIQASGYEALLQDWTSSHTEVMQEHIDEKLKFDIPETNPDGTTNIRGLVFNKANLVGGATFDLGSAILAPEFRILKGATAAARYVNRLPGLYGMWAMGNFYNDYKEAEAAGLDREYRVGYVMLNEFVQSAVENIINVKKFLPKGAPVNVKQIYGDAVRGAVTKMLSKETMAVGIKEFYSVTNKFIRDYFKTTGIFYTEEFLLEETIATGAKGGQGIVLNKALNTNFDETMFSLKQQEDNLYIGLSLGSMFGIGAGARGASLSKNEKYLHLSHMIDEFGVESVYNQLLEIKNSGSKTVDIKLAEDMVQLVPYMASTTKPSDMSNAKWLSIRTFIAQKEKMMNEMKGAPKSMESVYASQISEIDAKISELMGMSDDVLTKSLNDVGVTVMTTDKGVPYFYTGEKGTSEATTTPAAQPGDQTISVTAPTIETIQGVETTAGVEAPTATTQPAVQPGAQPVAPSEEITNQIAEVERRRTEEFDRTSTGNPIMAADYLFTGGVGAMLSTDYLLQALVGSFPAATKKINEIRGKYASKIGDIKNDVNTAYYNSMMEEVRAAINSTYENKKAEEIFNKILQNPTGLMSREGNVISAELDNINEENDAIIHARYDAEIADINKAKPSEATTPTDQTIEGAETITGVQPATTQTPLTTEQQGIANQIVNLESQKANEISSLQSQGLLNDVKVNEINQRYDPQINQLKSQIPQYATQESQRAQQEGVPEGRVPEYEPAQQGQVQTTQPTAAVSDSDIRRQREVVKANVSPVVQQIKALSDNVEDGATFNSDGTRYTGGGIVVPIASRNTTREDLSDDAIADFANEHRALLATGNFKIGLYKFPNSNMVSIDLNIVTDRKNLPAALEFAKRAGQESVFDMDNFQNIKTGADGMNVRTYNPNQLIRAAADIAQNKVTSAEELDAIRDTAPTKLRAFTPEDVTRMSDARSMTYDQFSSRYPGTTQQQYDFIKETGYDNQQDYDAWKQSKLDRANQIASDIRDAIANNRNGLTSVDMKNLSIDLQKAWSKIVPGLKLVWDDYERHVEEAGFPEEYKNYAGFFDPNSKVVYLNHNKIGLDTPIHEFGHVWFAVASMVDPKLIERGRALIKGTEYEARVRSTPEYANMSNEAIEEEALILAIGEKGAAIIDQMAKRNFMTWLSDLWKLVASKFGVKVEIDNLTLEEFTNLAAMDILAGGGILLTNTNPVEVLQSGVKPSIVPAKKLATRSAEAFKRYNTAVEMQSNGVSPAEIWAQTGMENVQGEWMTELNYAATPSIKIGDLKAYFEQKKIAGATFKLSDILSYPEFYSMYPKAKGVIIEIAKYNENDWVAAYNPYNNKMFLNLNDAAYNDVNGDYAAAILHEIQHYIQTQEGWRNGTSPAAEFSRAKDMLSNAERKSGNIDVANNISGLTVDGKYEGEMKDLYDRVYEGANFMYHYNFGEVQARNVETRYVDATRRKYAPTETQDRLDRQAPKAQTVSAKQVLDSNAYSKLMTQDANNYYFFHWSNEQRKVIDPNKFGNNRITSREERIARPSAAFFYTRPDFQEMGVGGYGHVVAIPKDKVYPATADPLNFYDEAKALFEKSHPGMAFGPNQQIGWITKVANSKGYEMVVAKWGNQLRAETTNKVKPEWYQMPDGWGIKTNPKYAKLKKGFNKETILQNIKKQVSPSVTGNGISTVGPVLASVKTYYKSGLVKRPAMDTNEFEAKIKSGELSVMNPYELLKDKTFMLTFPDNLIVGSLELDGKKIAVLDGGLFYALRHGVWSSTNLKTADQMARGVNELIDKYGEAYFVLVRGADDKHKTSLQAKVTFANTLLAIADKMGKASDIIKVIRKSYDITGARTASDVIELFNSYLKAGRVASGQTMEDASISYNSFISDLGNLAGETVGEIFRDMGYGDEYFNANALKKGNYIATVKGINLAFSELLQEDMLQNIKVGDAYAAIKVTSKLFAEEDLAHPSYPGAIKSNTKHEVILFDRTFRVQGANNAVFRNSDSAWGQLSFTARNIKLDQSKQGSPEERLMSDNISGYKSSEGLNVKPSISSRFGLEDGWANKAINEAFDMLRGGIFQITENPSGGYDLVYNGGTIETGITMEQAESFRDDMIKTALMKGYPQISEMTADNILFNAKRKNVSKRPGKKELPENVAEVESTQFNNRRKSMPQKAKEGLKRWFVKNFTVSEGAPKWMVKLKESRAGNVSYMVSRAEAKVKDMKKVASRIKFDDWKTFDMALRNYKPHSPSNPNWTGQQGFAPSNTQSPEFMSLPDEMKAFVVSMRAMLDGISEQLVRNGLVSPDLALKLEDNMGNYVHRAYALYTVGQKWADKLRKENKNWQTSREGDDIIQTAKHNLVQLFAGHIMATNPNLSIEEVGRMANEAADVEIETILQAKAPVLGSDEGSFLPYRNTGTLQQREDVPEWLRKLLGEFTDPGTAFLLSVSKSATLLHTSGYLASMRDKGMGNVFFEEGNRPQEASVRISAMNSALLKPLDGLYTTPEMAQILYDSENNTRQGWPILWKVMNINKSMKTVYSPVTQMKNFFSNTFFAVNNGHFDVTKMGVAFNYFKGQVVNNQTEAIMERLKPLFLRGVLNQSLTARELNDIFKTNDFERYVLDNAEKSGGDIMDRIQRTGRSIGRGASRLYQASDDFWKIFAYYNEQQDLSKALFGKKYDDLNAKEKNEVDDESADRVMNTYPTYDRVLGIFKGLSKAAVFGNFIAFRAESFRVFGNTVAYAYNDIVRGIREKNTRMVAYGSKRLMGMATYNAIRMEGIYWGAKYAGLGVSGLISSIWGSLFGGDDDDEERQAINSWVPSWAMSDCKIYDAKSAKDGKITFYPIGSLDPYAGVFNIFNAYSYGSEWLPEGGAKSAALEIVAPFVEPEMVIDNIMSAMKNKDAYGWMIYNEGDDKLMQAFEGGKYVAKKTLVPGAYTWIERMFYSRDEEGNKVFGFKPEELYLAPIGRFYNVDMARSWKSKLYNSKNVIFTQIESEFKKEKKNNGSFEDQANFKWNREILRLHKMYKDGISLGYPEEKLMELLKEVKMERRVLEAIVTGQTYQAFDKEGKITIDRLNEMILKGEFVPPSSTTPGGSYLDLLPKGDK